MKIFYFIYRIRKKVQRNNPSESVLSSPLVNNPGFKKVNFPDIFNTDISAFITKLQTVVNLIEKIDKLISKLCILATDAFNLTENSLSCGNQSSKYFFNLFRISSYY